MKRLIFFLFFSQVLIVRLSAQDDVNLFDYWKYYSDAKNVKYKYFCTRAFDLLDQRKGEIAGLKTRQDFLDRQKQVREKLVRILGPLPEKTPLNARVTGVIKRDDFRVEKVIYESLPNYYVTAALFIPKKARKAPAVIYASGHTSDGFRSDTYQHIIINLVKKGFVVLAFDPIGQGERLQYFDPATGKSPFGATSEHSYPGAQCYVSGYSPTKYFVWDAIRSVDYLLTRKEVDPERIGMTGRSGGGTQTAFAAAYDQRIKAAAPECFITAMKYVLKSIGPQDAEQNLFHQIYEKLDHADLIEVRAPKPTLLVTTTRDFFSIQGARETFKEAKAFYEALDAGENMHMVEDDSIHISTKKNREAMYAFFRKYLNNPGDPADLDVEVFRNEELWATPTGQLVTSLKGETLFTLNEKLAKKQIERLEESRANGNANPEAFKMKVKKWSGFEYPEKAGKYVFSGRYVKNGYKLEKYIISGSGRYMLPLVLYKPANGFKNEVIVLVDVRGKEYAANKDSLVHSLVHSGYAVVLGDVPGIGELGPGYLKGDAYIGKVSYNQWFAGILAGKSIAGLQAQDIIRLAEFARSQFGEGTGISAIAVGPVGSSLLHAAVFDVNIKKVFLIRAPAVFADIVTTRMYQPEFIPTSVSGAINDYDLPDLGAALAPRKLLLIDPLTAEGKVIKAGDKNYWSFLKDIYAQKSVPGHFEMVSGKDEQQTGDILIKWLR